MTSNVEHGLMKLLDTLEEQAKSGDLNLPGAAVYAETDRYRRGLVDGTLATTGMVRKWLDIFRSVENT